MSVNTGWVGGADGPPSGGGGGGSGDFTGPAGSTLDNLVSFADASGKVGKDSGVPAADVAANTSHAGNTSNPHGVTAAQTGGDLAGAPRPPNGSAGGDLAGSYPAPEVAAVTETSGPTSLVVGAISDGETLRRVGSALVGWRPPILCGSWGGKSDGLGRFVIVNGKTSDGDDTTKPKTRGVAPYDGTITRVAYQTQSGTVNVGMVIHVAGVAAVGGDFILGGVAGVAAVSVAVSAGDALEIEYDDDNTTGDKPGESAWTLYMEAS